MRARRTDALAITLSACLIGLVPGPIQALDDPDNGKTLARQWCASCHLVTPDQERTNADAPPFMTIAGRSDKELDRLSTFLVDPHPKMPNFNLSRQEIADIVAYIRSLRQVRKGFSALGPSSSTGAATRWWPAAQPAARSAPPTALPRSTPRTPLARADRRKP